MFGVFGLVGLIVFIYLKPQEFIPALERLPFLYLFLALTVFGIACAAGLMMVGNYQRGAIDFIFIDGGSPKANSTTRWSRYGARLKSVSPSR